MSEPRYELRTQRKIEFADTDMGGIVHFSRFFIFMETAEHEYLQSLGTSVVLEDEGRSLGWPRVSATCVYKNPARYGETLDIHVRVWRKGSSSLTYVIDFTRDGRAIANGRVTAVCCELAPGKKVRPIPIPQSIADRVAEAPR